MNMTHDCRFTFAVPQPNPWVEIYGEGQYYSNVPLFNIRKATTGLGIQSSFYTQTTQKNGLGCLISQFVVGKGALYLEPGLGFTAKL